MNKQPIKTKFILGAVLFGVIFLATVILNGAIFFKKNSVQKEYQKLEDDLKFVLSRTGSVPEVKKEHEETLKNLFDNTDKYDTELSYLKDLRTLKNSANRFSVEVIELVPKLEDTMPPLKQYITLSERALERYEIELRLTGKFRDVGKFLNFLDTDNRRIYLNMIVLNPMNESGEIIEAYIKAYSYGLRKL